MDVEREGVIMNVSRADDSRWILCSDVPWRVGELLSLSKDLSVERCGYLARCRRIGPDRI
jgi:hypothetical protein